jgi:hypothetical protein
LAEIEIYLSLWLRLSLTFPSSPFYGQIQSDPSLSSFVRKLVEMAEEKVSFEVESRLSTVSEKDEWRTEKSKNGTEKG